MVKSGTPTQVKAKFATWSDNWYGKCAAVVMTVCRHFGYVGTGTWAYASAREAFEAATIESEDWQDAPAGAIHYWDYYGKNSRGELGNWGHVGVGMTRGGSRVLNATNHANVAYGRGVGESTIPQISGRVGRYRGWSRKYGKSFYADIRPEKGGTPAGGAPVKAQERKVRDRVGQLNGRDKPSNRSGELAGSPLKPGTVGQFDGYKLGREVTVAGITSNVWFHGAISGRYFPAAGFTTQSKAGLTYLGVYREPIFRRKHRYARLPKPWFFFTSENKARNASPTHQGPMLPAGDYRILDGDGPYLVNDDGRHVYVGTGRTNPRVVRK